MKKQIAAMLCLCFAFSAAACGNKGQGGESGQTIDKNKTQIYINVYGGGTGTSWITEEANEYNKTLEDYQIYIQDEKREAGYIIDEVNAASGVASAYFTVDIAFQELVNTDKLVDLTPILETTLEGESKKIGDKLTNRESWMKLASKNGSGCYLLPYCDSIGGLVFDYGDFVERGWLEFADGNGFTCNPEDASIAIGIRKGSDLAPEFNNVINSLSKTDKESMMDAAIARQPQAEE